MDTYFDKSYNLADSPFLRCHTNNGVEEMGLMEALKRLTEIRKLDCESPLIEIGLWRLLGAVAYSIKWDDLNRQKKIMSEDEIKKFSESFFTEGLDPKIVDVYFEKNRDKFYFLGGEKPFMTLPPTREELDKIKSDKAHKGRYSPWKIDLDAMITDSSFNNLKSSQHYLIKRKYIDEPMPAAEAARWISGFFCFDTNSFKPQTKVGQLGRGTNIFIEGDNLAQTILFNCPLFRDASDRTYWDNGNPYWDQDIKKHYEKALHRRERDSNIKFTADCPRNIIELLLMPTRFITLYPSEDGNEVIALDRAKGVSSRTSIGYQYNYLTDPIEPSYSWNIDDKGKISPRKESNIWVSFYKSLRAKGELKPGTASTVKWTQYLLENTNIGDRFVTFSTFKVEYGNQNMLIKDYVKRSMIISTSLFSTELGGIGQTVEEVLTSIDSAAKMVMARITEVFLNANAYRMVPVNLIELKSQASQDLMGMIVEELSKIKKDSSPSEIRKALCQKSKKMLLGFINQIEQEIPLETLLTVTISKSNNEEIEEFNGEFDAEGRWKTRKVVNGYEYCRITKQITHKWLSSKRTVENISKLQQIATSKHY